MFGISYWSNADGALLSEKIRYAMEELSGGRDRLWDMVAINDPGGGVSSYCPTLHL
jgi:hypothetical protein